MTALMVSCESNLTEMANLLINKNALLDVQVGTLIIMLLQFFLCCLKSTESVGLALLHCICPIIVDLKEAWLISRYPFLLCYVYVSVQDNDGMTALMTCTFNGFGDIVKSLVCYRHDSTLCLYPQSTMHTRIDCK